jgi:pyruvate kinase
VRRARKTKVVATIGPATRTPEAIRRLFAAGADIFRINMSHTDHAILAATVQAVRALEADVGRPVAILVDLQGPKLRVGEIAGGALTLKAGDSVGLEQTKAASQANVLPIPHPEIFAALKSGDTLLIDDGKICLTIGTVAADRADAAVVRGGKVTNHKGINLPQTLLPIPALTPKDRSDLDAALHHDIDWVALSFVQRPDDVAELRKLVAGRAGVLAKIEKPAALSTLDRIVEIADAVMVARGDLGVELPLESVPGRQKEIVRAARRAGKPVVVATQMLESMISVPVPTRAEVSDVATAIFDGADAVMLSAETATGAYAADAVAVMNRIACAVEGDPQYGAIIDATRVAPEPTMPDAIMAAVHDVTHTIRASAIVCWTKSGSTGLRAARERPDAPVIALTPIPEMARRLTLAWGLHCVIAEDAKDIEDVVERACRIAHAEGFAKPGERIVISAGLPLGTPGATNMLRVAFVRSR